MKTFFENDGKNEVLNQSTNPTAEGENQQASLGASPVKFDASEPISFNSTHSTAIPAPNASDGESGKRKKQKKVDKKDYKPAYSEQKKKELESISMTTKEAIKATMENPKIPTIPFGCHNCLINLTEAYENGINILTPAVNRKHGKDMKKTGESIRMYGAQRHLLVITKSMADAAGIEVDRFSSDKRTGDLRGNDFVLIDGNGRGEYLLELEKQDRPIFWATFIEPDSLGYYNPSKVMEVINTELSVWKTSEHLQKRLLEEGQGAHEGWCLVQQLVKNGYMYQAACMAYTLDTDRIKVRKVNSGDANEVFAHIESAKKIHVALVDKFGEGDDKVLKTKEFPKEVSILWRKLKDHKDNENWATDIFVEFVEQFKDNKVQEILNAKTTKGGLNKDEIRKKILNEQFNQFIGRKGIDLD